MKDDEMLDKETVIKKQELVLTPNQPLGTDSDPAELQKRIEGSVVNED